MHFDVNTGELVEDAEDRIIPGTVNPEAFNHKDVSPDVTVSPNESVNRTERERKIQVSEDRNPALVYGPDDEARAKLIEEQVKKVKKANKKNRPGNFSVNKKLLTAVLIIAVVLIAGLATVFLLPARTKIKLMAFATIKEDSLFGDLQTASVANSKNNTVRISGNFYSPKSSDFNGSSFKYEARKNLSKKKLSIESSIQLGGAQQIIFNSYMDSNRVILSLPTLTDYNMCYNYNSDSNNGYLISQLGDKEVKDLNEQLRMSLNKDADNINVYLFNEFYNSLYFTKAESQEFLIDGKNCKCNGYKAVMDAAKIRDLLDRYSEMYDDGLVSDKSKISDNYVKNFSDTNLFSTLKKTIGDEDNLEVQVFYNRFKLAAIIIKSTDSTEAQLFFQGGDTRMENMLLQIGGDDKGVTLTKEGNTEKALHNFSYTLKYGDLQKKLLVGSYNEKSGKFECVNPENENGFCMQGTIKAGMSGLNIRFDKFQFADDWYVLGNIDVERGAIVNDFPSDAGIDLGIAGEGEIQEILMDIIMKAPKQLPTVLQ